MFVTLALLLNEAQVGPSPVMMNFVLIGGMIALFYFLLIRPQNKARRALEDKLSKLKSGDEVLLTSGLYATVDRVVDNLLYLKLGNNVVKARKNAVAAMATELEDSRAKNQSVIS
ncbi:MAG: preprotein translocase subunit YajC [Holophagaceae bacterium]|nr:preprotein translocase subunit YajC [Holophagaceae bacterium]